MFAFRATGLAASLIALVLAVPVLSPPVGAAPAGPAQHKTIDWPHFVVAGLAN